MKLVQSISTYLKSRPPLSDRATVVILLVGTAGLLVTIGTLNGGVAPSASAWDGIKAYLTTLLGSTFILVLAFLALVVCVWQIAHGRGYAHVATILGVLAVALLGPGIVSAAATATRSPETLVAPLDAVSAPAVAPLLFARS